MKMQTYVINLDRSVDRWQHIHSHLSDLENYISVLMLLMLSPKVWIIQGIIQRVIGMDIFYP